MSLIAAGVIEGRFDRRFSISSIDDGTVTAKVAVRPSLAALARSTLIRSRSCNTVWLTHFRQILPFDLPA